MNKYVTPLLILVLLAAGWLWLRAERKAAAEAALAQIRADSVTFVLEQLDSSYADYARQDSLFRDSLESLGSVLYHEGSRSGHRTGSVDLEVDRRSVRWIAN